MNFKSQKNLAMALPNMEDEQYQELLLQPVSKSDVVCQTEPQQIVHSSQTVLHDSKCSCSSSNQNFKSEQDVSERKRIRKLEFQICKLKMQISLLRLQNNVLEKNSHLTKDQYYEGVINGMQAKIEELIQQRRDGQEQ